MYQIIQKIFEIEKVLQFADSILSLLYYYRYIAIQETFKYLFDVILNRWCK